MLFYNLLALVLIGFGHFYLFQLLLGTTQISKRFYALLSILFMVLLAMAIGYSGFVELNVLALIGFLVILGTLTKAGNLLQVIYFALLSTVLFTVIKNGLLTLTYYMYLDSPFPYYSWTPSVLQVVTLLGILIAMYIARNKIQQTGHYLRSSKLFIPTFIIVALCTVFLLIINFPTVRVLSNLHELYGEQLYISMTAISIILMLIISMNVYRSRAQLIEQHEKQMHEQLIDYVTKLEFMHDELATFRHDYMNLMLTLEEAVRTEDVQQIKQIYEGTIAPTTGIVNNQQLELTKLSRVLIAEVKSVLSVKIVTAQQRKLSVTVDIPEPINELYMATESFIRILSVLIDNAIEAAEKSTERSICIALFTVHHTQYCIVKNSMDNPRSSLDNLYAKNYSTKGKDRGLGLYSIKRIVNQHPNITLSTAAEQHSFEQKLIIKKQPFMNESKPIKKSHDNIKKYRVQ